MPQEPPEDSITPEVAAERLNDKRAVNEAYNNMSAIMIRFRKKSQPWVDPKIIAEREAQAKKDQEEMERKMREEMRKKK